MIYITVMPKEEKGALYEPIIQESDAIFYLRVKLDPFDNKHFKLVLIPANSKSNREMLGTIS
jgi:hypothetical protein